MKERREGCGECIRKHGCIERKLRGPCAGFRSKKEITEAIREVNDDWYRTYGAGNATFIRSPGGNADGKHQAYGDNEERQRNSSDTPERIENRFDDDGSKEK